MTKNLFKHLDFSYLSVVKIFDGDLILATQRGEGCSQQKNTPFSAYNPNSYCQIILICLGMWMVMKKRAGYLKIANV